MKPIEFEGSNIIFGKDQEPYKPLPALKFDSKIISCWKLTWRERIKILFTGKMWTAILAFNKPLQPISLTIEKPFEINFLKKNQMPIDAATYCFVVFFIIVMLVATQHILKPKVKVIEPSGPGTCSVACCIELMGNGDLDVDIENSREKI